jgi:hypothetical protein
MEIPPYVRSEGLRLVGGDVVRVRREAGQMQP